MKLRTAWNWLRSAWLGFLFILVGLILVTGALYHLHEDYIFPHGIRSMPLLFAALLSVGFGLTWMFASRRIKIRRSSCWLIIIVGVLCMLLGGCYSSVLLNFKSSEGVVDRVDEHEIIITYYRFTNRQVGLTIERGPLVPHYNGGDKVNVLYDPDRKDAMLASTAWIDPFTAGGTGVLLILAGLSFRYRGDAPSLPKPSSLKR